MPARSGVAFAGAVLPGAVVAGRPVAGDDVVVAVPDGVGTVVVPEVVATAAVEAEAGFGDCSVIGLDPSSLPHAASTSAAAAAAIAARRIHSTFRMRPSWTTLTASLPSRVKMLPVASPRAFDVEGVSWS